MTIQRLLAKLVSLALVCVFFTLPALAQTKTVSGKITDDKGNPLPGVSVTVKGSRIGTSTDPGGNFMLNVKTSAKTLVLSSVGFADKEVDITNETTINASLVPSSNTLGDLVVTGYTTTRKKDLTGAVEVVGTKDFNAGIISSPVQQIQGKVPGLVITQQGGDPNQNPIIHLRGQTSLSGAQTPLIVVDGVTLDDPTIVNTIPPGDIESYTVLKDASAAAIYGSRGANGVIIITTKKGHAGRAQVDYNGAVGIDKVAKLYPLANVAQWKAGAESIGIPDSTIATYDQGGNTNWNKAILQTAFTTSHSVGVSGGSGGFNYRGSVNYTNNDGIVLNSGRQQIGLRFNAEQKALNDRLDIQLGIVNSQTQRKYTDYGVFDYIFSAPPTYPVYKNGGYYTFVDFEEANPVEHLNEEVNKGQEHFTQMYGTVNFEIVKGLKLGTTGSLSYYTLAKQNYTPTFPFELNVPTASQGSFFNNSGKGDIHVNYAHTWGDNNLTATAVYEYNNFTEGGFTAGSQQGIVSALTYNALELGNPSYNNVYSYEDQYLLISYLGRITYSFANKYLATVTARRDGSSKFGINNRYGTFPSFDLGWRISQENFMKNISWINELKIRAGYGVTGNSDNITPYETIEIIGPKNPVQSYYNPSNTIFQYPPVYTITQNPNPDLKWEQRQGANIGFDYALFDNRVTGSFNYFNDKTINLLYDNYQVPTPPFVYGTILANVGDLTNKGVEFSINADVVRGRDFTWSIGGNISTVNTKITSLSGNYAGYHVSTDNIQGGVAEGRGLSSNPITYLKKGYAPYVFQLPKYEGVDKNGNQLFDSAGVKSETLAENSNPTLYYINPTPKFFYGINNNFTYKNWGLDFFLRGVAGQKIFNNTALDIAFIKRLPGNNVFTQALHNGILDQPVASTLWLEKAGYLRLDNLALSYSFKGVPGFQTFRVYFAANNLFVITHYSGLDPEVRTGQSYTPGSSLNPANTNVNTEAYIDANYGSDGYYPKARSFSFGVNVTLNK